MDPRMVEMLAGRQPANAPAAPQPLGILGTERVGMTAEGRPIIRNPDGSNSTERSITGPWGPEGQWTNIPSMFGGKQLSEEEAVNIMRANNWTDPETGRKAVWYPDQNAALAVAQQRTTQDLGQYGGGQLPGIAPPPQAPSLLQGPPPGWTPQQQGATQLPAPVLTERDMMDIIVRMLAGRG